MANNPIAPVLLAGGQNGNGHDDDGPRTPRAPKDGRAESSGDVRRVDDLRAPVRAPTQSDRIEAVQLEQAGFLGEMARDVKMNRSAIERIERTVDGLLQGREGVLTTLRTLEANVTTIMNELRQSRIAASLPPIRPTLPSLNEKDLEVIDRTKDGSPVYRASQSQLQAVREKAYREAAIGEAARVRAIVTQQLELAATEREAAQMRAVKVKVGLPVFVASLIATIGALGHAVWERLTTNHP